jgi:hypothetical protein
MGKEFRGKGASILNLRGALGVAFIHLMHRAEPSLATPADQVFGMNGSKAILLHPTGRKHAETKFRGGGAEQMLANRPIVPAPTMELDTDLNLEVEL